MKKKPLPIQAYFIFECIFIVLGTVCSYELVIYFKEDVLTDIESGPFLAGLGMILPMSLLLGLFMSHISRQLYKHLARVTDGLEQVAQGNYDIHLNLKKAGPFPHVYDNFNHMVDELSSVQTLRDDFINNFSHEFKTPISSINGFANLLLDEDKPLEEQRQYLSIIAEESNRLANLANQTLLLSNLNSQTLIHDKINFSLDEQIKQCAILLSNQWESKNLSLSVDLEEITFWGNPSLMEHVWINLFNNAIKFTPEGGSIEVKAYKNKNIIHIFFIDSGIGIDEETRKNIFQKYYQGESAQKVEGLGLGLSIVSKIISLCNGTIEVESTPDVGSSFHISFFL